MLVLLSYDQVQHSETSFWSITYLLLLPMWFVPGERLTTETFLDAVLIDLEGRSMLVREDGTSVIADTYCPMYFGSHSRESSNAGFQLATDALLAALLPSTRDALGAAGTP